MISLEHSYMQILARYSGKTLKKVKETLKTRDKAKE